MGLMWFGTSDGLNRFDGKKFDIFYSQSGGQENFPHSSINYITRKNDEEMWVCTDLGVSVYNHLNGSFKRFGLPNNKSINVCLIDKDQNTWFGSNSGLIRFNNIDSSYTTYSNKYNRLSNDLIRCIYQDSENNLWVGTQNGLNLFDQQKSSFTNYFFSREPGDLTGNDVWAITEDRFGRLWIGVAYKGLYLLEKKHNELKTLKFKKIVEGSVNRLQIDKNDNLWIGKGGGGGLIVLDLKTIDSLDNIKPKKIVYKHINPRTPSDNTITSIFLDREGDIWIGTFGAGIKYFNSRKKQFFNITVGPDFKKSISSQLVNYLFDDGHNLWIGTEMGLEIYKRNKNEFIKIKNPAKKPNKFGGNSIYSIQKDKKGFYWVGTWNGGLRQYNKYGELINVYIPTGQEGSINSANIFAIHDDSKGNLWVGTIGGGLNKFDYKTGTFKNYVNNPDNPFSIHNNSVNDIYETKDGLLLLTVYSALEIFNPETGTFNHYVHDPNDKNSISSGFTLSIFEDSRANIWIATNTGLNLFNKKTGKFTRYTKEHGLPNNTIQSILEDEMGNLWIGTNRGLAKFIDGINFPQNPEFIIFDRNDGLASDEFTLRAAFKNNEGWMFFGTSLGYVTFHPDSIFINTKMPEIIIKDFELITSESEKTNTSFSPHGINSVEVIKLTNKMNSFTIHFAAMNYLDSHKNKFKCMLEGLETEWRIKDNNQSVTYTGLRPGTYTFLVTGSNNDGLWSKKPKKLVIIIRPPWYGTLLFKIILVIATILTVLLIIKIRLNFLKRQTLILEERVKTRTLELSRANKMLHEKQEEISLQNEELTTHRYHLETLISKRTADLENAKQMAEKSDRLKTAFLANMSHEIRTPMNAIVGFSTLLGKSELTDAEKDEYIKIITSNSETLLVLINDILDISLIESNQLALNKSNFSINRILLELEKYFLLNNSKNINICFKNQDDNIEVFINNDAVRLNQIVSNLLSNAYKYTEMGSINFGFNIENGNVIFYVADTGIGIDKNEFKNIFDHFYKIEKHGLKYYRGTGIGLAICKKLVNLMGGEIWVESYKGEGSTFYFSLPNN